MSDFSIPDIDSSKFKQQKMFVENTREDIVFSLSKYLPHGDLSISASNENADLYKLLYGFSGEMQRVEQKIQILSDNMFPYFANKYLDLWNKFVKIPDSCLSFSDSFYTEELNIKYILSKLFLIDFVYTKQDLIHLAKFLGVIIDDILVGADVGDTFPLPFPSTFGNYYLNGAFDIIIVYDALPIGDTFPLPFPSEFSNSIYNFLSKVIKTWIIPITCNVHFRYKIT